jgi:acyl-CoA oxidase
MGVIFAQLVLGEVKHGVHVFLVPIRDYQTHEFIPGVVCGDCGPKAGLDGIDNGFILFDHYRVSYDSLLDKHGHLTADGKYKSKIASKEKRFAAMLSGLCRGRLTIVKGSETLLRNAVTVAIRYGAVRRQFGKSGQPETPILDYPLHRYRLSIHLARTAASSISFQHVLNLFATTRDLISADPEGKECAELHAVISALKPITTVWTQKGTQECREACGGLGYSAFSMLSHWRNVNDVNLTWEGDNNVLIQQSARYVLKEAQNLLKGKPVTSSYLKYLNIDSASVFSQKADIASKKAFTLELGVEMFHYRVNMLLQKCLVRLQENVAHYEISEAWNVTQPFYLQELGKSFGEVILLEEFAKKAESVSCPRTKLVLRLLAELVAYYSLNESLILFREHDYLTGAQAVWLQDHLMALSDQVGETSVKIVDALAWSDAYVGSVLGKKDGQVYKNMIDAVESTEGCYEKPTWLSLLREVRGSP